MATATWTSHPLTAPLLSPMLSAAPMAASASLHELASPISHAAPPTAAAALSSSAEGACASPIHLMMSDPTPSPLAAAAAASSPLPPACVLIEPTAPATLIAQRASAKTADVYALLFALYQFALRAVLGLLSVLLVIVKVFESVDVARVWRRRSKAAAVAAERTKSVVIIGGGFSGALTAQLLERDFEVTLIDTKNYFEFTPSVKYLRTANFVRQSVTHLHPSVVELANGDRIPYDYLLICTGASYYMPGQQRDAMDAQWDSDRHYVQQQEQCLLISTRIPSLAQYHERVSRARHVLIIGAGTVGVELAAEIAETFPDVAVTMVGPLLARCPSKSIAYTESWMRRFGVRLLSSSKVTRQEGRRFFTNRGEVLEVDVAFLCTGNIPNSELLRRSANFSQSVCARGFARASSTLQLDGFENVFVAGDVMFLAGEEEKLCQNAIEEAFIVANNIRLSAACKPLKHYVPNSKPMLISLGKFDCVLTFRNFVFTGFIPALMKEFVEYFQMSKFNAACWHAQLFVRRRSRSSHLNCQ